MKKIISLLIITILTSCNNDEFKKIKIENIDLKTELDSLKSIFKKEEEKKHFYGNYINSKKRLI